MKIVDVLSSDFLKELAAQDREMYKYFKDTDIESLGEKEKYQIDLLQTSPAARKQFIVKLVAELERGKRLAQVLPAAFIEALKIKDDHIYKLLSIAPASQYPLELKEALKSKEVQDQVLSWFDSPNKVMARYKVLNLSMAHLIIPTHSNEANPNFVFNRKSNKQIHNLLKKQGLFSDNPALGRLSFQKAVEESREEYRAFAMHLS